MSDPARCPVTDEHGARDLLPGAVPGCYFGVNEPTPRRASPDSPPEPETVHNPALRALTSTLGQRTEQEATYPPTVTLNPEVDMNLSRRWRCCDCGKITDHLLSAPDPFQIGEELYACPHCWSVMGVRFAALCDEPGCTEAVTSGWGDPYRWTCSYHEPPKETK